MNREHHFMPQRPRCRDALFLGAICLLPVLVAGCKELADQGFSTVSFRYGVMYTGSIFQRREVTGIYIENADKEAHEDARIDLELFGENGDVLKKSFLIGSLQAGGRWEKELDKPVGSVKTIQYLYTTNRGAGKGTLSVDESPTYNDEEFEEARKELTFDRYSKLGEALLAAAHPTGNYGSTEEPAVSLSSDKRTITVELAVKWRGAISGDPYTSKFCIETGRDGIKTIDVTYDNGTFPPSKERIREIERMFQSDND